MQTTKGIQPKHRRVLLYGQHGVGKSTWASEAPSPIFLNFEDGLADIDCEATKPLKTIGEVNECLSWLLTQEHTYKTCVLDSIDWFEQIVMAQVAHEFGERSYQEIDYGKGAGRVAAGWQWLLSNLDFLRTQRSMSVILLSHSRIEKFNNPSGVAYDRYVPDLCKISFGFVQEWCDEVLFAQFRVLTSEQKEAFGSKRSIAVGGKERYILTSESAASMAKNRLRLPEELPMTWAAYFACWPKAKPTTQAMDWDNVKTEAGNIAGAVVDGSSKK
jgi:hypothetical protein